jgi:hypothetical protein
VHDHDHDRVLHALTVAEAAELLGLAQIKHQLADLAKAVEHIHRTVHRLEEQQMTTKDEILAQLGGVKTTLVETKKDLGRVAEDLRTALANNDLSAIAASVDELQNLATGIDADAEAASPEPTMEPAPEQPAEPTPADRQL